MTILSSAARQSQEQENGPALANAEAGTGEKDEVLLWFDPPFPHSLGNRLGPALLLTLLAGLVFLFLMPLFSAPFERDQGVYATIARGWIHGAVPYRDLWDNKGPLLFAWYVASFLIMGENTMAPRIAAALAAGLSIPFLWAAVRKLFDRHKAALAAILFALSFANVYLQVTANAEVFMLLPLTAGFWAFAVGSRKEKGPWFLLCGALTALAMFTRQSAVLSYVAYIAWLVVVSMKYPARRSAMIRAIIWLAGGAGLGALPFLVYFAAHGALGELWFAMFGFNARWIAEQSFWLKLVPPLFIEPGPLVGGLIFWILAAVGFQRLWQLRNCDAWLVIAFLAASEAAAQAMGKGSAHYMIQVLPGASIAAAFGFPRALHWWKQGSFLARAGLGTAALTAVAGILFAYVKPTPADRFMAQYTYRDYADDAVGAPLIADAIAARSTPGACIYEWGRSSQIYFLADRQPCSRWFYNRPFEVSTYAVSELMSDLRMRPPSVLLDTSDMPPPPELEKFIREKYRYAGRVQYAKIFALAGK
jgi:4-amino-4-deoxy-L-arabinose transferase-like glycosyltransferase